MDTVALKRKTNFKESSKEKTKQKCGKKVKIQKLTNNQENKEHITCLLLLLALRFSMKASSANE